MCAGSAFLWLPCLLQETGLNRWTCLICIVFGDLLIPGTVLQCFGIYLLLNPSHPPASRCCSQVDLHWITFVKKKKKSKLETLCLRATSLFTPQQPAGMSKHELSNFHQVWAVKLISAVKSFCFPPKICSDLRLSVSFLSINRLSCIQLGASSQSGTIVNLVGWR